VRITREKLIDLARRETVQRASRGGVISGYLIGSVAHGEPLLGGTADIDLVLIHDEKPPAQREVVPLSPEIHLDITHHSRDLYMNPRELRIHPWLGPSMCEPIFLHDPEHFFEWAQAGARGQFFRPDYTYARAHAFLRRARQLKAVLGVSNRWLKSYTRALLEAANAVACLSGFPQAGRRLTLSLEKTLEDLGQSTVYAGFMRLLGVETFNGWDLPKWLTAWARAYDDAVQNSDNPELTPMRRDYYLTGFQALADAGRPEAVVWTLLRTWEWAMHALDIAGGADHHQPSWDAVREHLGLQPISESSRVGELERFLDHIEELLEDWAERSGA
jgi:predicted nucleotidyltransferase